MAVKTNYDVFPFVGVPTFWRAPLVTPENGLAQQPFDIGVLGVPFDEGATYSPGSRFGPRGIRDHSLRVSDLGYYDHQEKRAYLSDPRIKAGLLDFGDVSIIPTDIEGNLHRITEAAKYIVDRDALLVSMGGDHSVTFPLVQAFSEKSIHVIQFDAHPDFLPISPQFEYTNGHPFSQISRLPHVKSLTQVGIRSIRSFDFQTSISEGNRVIDINEARAIGPQGVAESLPAGEDCYISIDIDALDISLTPGCGSAEPDGFTYAQLRDCLSAVAKRNRIVGFDFVEVAPMMDIATQNTSYIAMLTMIELLGKICDQPYWTQRYEGR